MILQCKGGDRVLVCPLGWGLGHATRMLPIIDTLLKKDCKVIVAADSHIAEFIQSNYPTVETDFLPSLKVRLGKSRFANLTLIVIAFKIIWHTWLERRAIGKLVNRHEASLVISDNRYGLYAKYIPSVLVTHQFSIQFPWPFKWAKPIGEWYVRRYANRFSQCWIPDNPGENSLTGMLTQPKKLPSNVHFIGLLSRFSGAQILPSEFGWELLGIVSGPEPQRQMFEDELVNLSNKLGVKCLIVQGKPGGDVKPAEAGLASLVPHLSSTDMAKAIVSSKYIVCRSGYSTIMDLIALNRRALLVPTPGQTEQEYLANHLSAKNIFKMVSQKNLRSIRLINLNEIEKTPIHVSFKGVFFND